MTRIRDDRRKRKQRAALVGKRSHPPFHNPFRSVFMTIGREVKSQRLENPS